MKKSGFYSIALEKLNEIQVSETDKYFNFRL